MNDYRLAEATRLRTEVLGWLEEMRVPDTPCGTYKMGRSTEATLFSSCFAVFIRELWNDLVNLTPSQRQEWIHLIQSWQDEETGFFIAPHLKNRGEFSPVLGKDHDIGYTTWQSTTFCISALKALDGKILHAFRFLEEWKNPVVICSYLDSLEWRKPWTVGNLTMFLGICLIADFENSNDKRAKEAIDAFFDYHDRIQDPKTGLWGTDCGARISDALFGAMHQFLLYYYTDRPLQFMDRIVDCTLLLQQPDGLFAQGGGGDGCVDLDAVDTLVNMYQRLDYRREDIRKCLSKTLNALTNGQGNDGGFIWSNRRRFGIIDWLKFGTSLFRFGTPRDWYRSLRDTVYFQTLAFNKPRMSPGWTETPMPARESDMFSTWFRSLAIALISEVLTESPYARMECRYLRAPGLGYFAKEHYAKRDADA